jgi:OH-DDVA oxygenase/3-O-methylgallate 3,4-dioxygenase
MAEIVLGMWTTHGPTLSTTPEQWLLRLPADHENKAHPFRGNTYDFESLVELRKDEDDFAAKCTLEERTERYARCRAAIDEMARVFEETKPDVAVIFGNDQSELFLPNMMPTFTIFNGDPLWNVPATEEQAARHPPGIHEAEWGHKPSEYTEYPNQLDLANLLISELSKNDFDIARANALPEHEGHWHSGMGHAFGFIFRQIMKDKAIPTVPIVQNTFFPPNQPSAKRCYEFGKVVGKTIESWDSDLRVAVFGSGGMSHFVIDEDLDQLFLNAIAERDWQTLTSLDDELLQSGTSELKNWIGAAGALFPTKLSGGIVDYVPCYRSEAGTGTANGFLYWK